jgi:YjbE family integral membrane protein
MTGWLDTEVLLRVLSIVAIDLTVSGENALVIALAVRHLPPRQQLHGRIWGTAGAVVLRVAFIFVVTFLLKIPLLQLVGGLLLVWIAIKLVRQPVDSEPHVKASSSLAGAIWTIVVADAVMSLDNVLAVAGAAHGDFVLVIFGVALSLPIVVWGSGLVGKLMDRFPRIIAVGGGVLGYVAGEMMVEDRVVHAWTGDLALVGHAIPIVLGLALTALGWFSGRRSVERATTAGSGAMARAKAGRDRRR